MEPNTTTLAEQALWIYDARSEIAMVCFLMQNLHPSEPLEEWGDLGLAGLADHSLVTHGAVNANINPAPVCQFYWRTHADELWTRASRPANMTEQERPDPPAPPKPQIETWPTLHKVAESLLNTVANTVASERNQPFITTYELFIMLPEIRDMISTIIDVQPVDPWVEEMGSMRTSECVDTVLRTLTPAQRQLLANKHLSQSVPR